jgi:protein-tyrosine phosphatase
MSGTGLGYEILGAVKVKDGLFIGDELAAQDLEFVVANKVTRVINCCGRQVPNHWEPIGVIYLTYFWVDADNQVVLDPRDVVANEIFRFIEEALEGAESVLIHSVRGQSRSCCVLSAYMMKKYNWGLRKTMEFLSSRRPDLNLKPSFLQQLSGYERRLMAQTKHAFSLDWSDADFSKLESEDLLLRNTYINSQMGPLAEFHAGDMAIQGKPRKLMWADNSVDDKLRLEKPAGADRHNVQNCKRNQMGQPILKSVLKTPKHRPGGKGQETQSVLSRPTTASSNENPQEAHPQNYDSAASAAPKAPAPAAHMQGAPMNGILGGPLGGNLPNMSASHGSQQAPGPPDGGAVASYTFAQQNVPTAWGAESERGGGGLIAGYATGLGGPPHGDEHARFPGGSALGPVSGAYPDLVQPGMPPAYHANSSAPARGPTNNIRDSLSGLSRRESPEPGGRASSRDSLIRDPSPKTSVSKRDSPLPYRGESPLRLLSRSGRGSSPHAAPGSDKRQQHPNGSNSGGYNPQFGQIGFCLGGIRAGASGGPSPAPASGTVPGSNSAPPRGMNAFRSNGPVRAKADLLGAGAEGGNSSLRRSRPATAPTTRASGSRPASPLGQPSANRATGSRPSSPQTRPSSPGHQPAQNKPVVTQAAYQPLTQLDKTKHRSLSSHMRRAPSPTPAFNRNASPSRPRWRA